MIACQIRLKLLKDLALDNEEVIKRSLRKCKLIELSLDKSHTACRGTKTIINTHR